MSNVHIDAVLALCDSIFGPDTDAPVPTEREMAGLPVNFEVASPMRGLTAADLYEPRWYSTRPASVKGAFGVRSLSDLSLEDLERFLGDKGERRLANNTWISRNIDGRLHIGLHRTTILTFERREHDVIITLNTGGYRTVTTKQRINALLPAGYRVYAKDFDWYLSTPHGTFSFIDGMQTRIPG